MHLPTFAFIMIQLISLFKMTITLKINLESFPHFHFQNDSAEILDRSNHYFINCHNSIYSLSLLG